MPTLQVYVPEETYRSLMGLAGEANLSVAGLVGTLADRVADPKSAFRTLWNKSVLK